MNKNFSNFLKEKGYELKNINEDYWKLAGKYLKPIVSPVKFIKHMAGNVNLEEEEQRFIFKINQAFKRYANKLIGVQYFSQLTGKKLSLERMQTDSIYRNLKNNFKIMLNDSYKGIKINFNNSIKIKNEAPVLNKEEQIFVDEKKRAKKAKKNNITSSQANGLGMVAPALSPSQNQNINSGPPAAQSSPDEDVNTSKIDPSNDTQANKPSDANIPVLNQITNFKFMHNLNKLILNIKRYFENSDEKTMPEKPMFNTLELIRRLYKYSEVPDDPKRRFKKHIQNIKYLGNENWNILLKKIIAIFMSRQCDFADDAFTINTIETFEKKASMYMPAYLHYSSLINSLRKNINWKNIALSLTEIDNFISEFCKSDPDLCAKKGKGSGKLLPKLKENKNIKFYDWLLINETNYYKNRHDFTEMK